MSDVTRILSAIEQGDQKASEKLLPLVYEELRKLAAQKMALENLGQTLQVTALVHEAYMRLVDVDIRRYQPRGCRFSYANQSVGCHYWCQLTFPGILKTINTLQNKCCTRSSIG